MKKVCKSCKAELPVSEFYPDKVYKWSRRCKECEKKASAAKYKANPEKKKAHGRAYRAANKEEIRIRRDTPEQRAKDLVRVKEYQKLYPEKANARNRVRYAIITGRLIRKPCEQCGAEPTHGHHDDYSKPLDVRWLCATCHKRYHSALKQSLR